MEAEITSEETQGGGTKGPMPEAETQGTNFTHCLQLGIQCQGHFNIHWTSNPLLPDNFSGKLYFTLPPEMPENTVQKMQ